MQPSVIPTEITDLVNAKILAVSEDRIAGFLDDPFAEIARIAELPVDTVLERLRGMLDAGVIRRVRQTLMSTNLAPGALVAWRVANDRLDEGFYYLSQKDPAALPWKDLDID
ncbi:MAG: Lrp/AsnC family transcriptional regulator, partial [bacterium]